MCYISNTVYSIYIYISCVNLLNFNIASLSFKSPFVAPFGKKEDATAKKQEFAVGNSDHLTMLKAYKGWIDAERQSSYSGYTFCQDNFLSIKSLQVCQIIDFSLWFVIFQSDLNKTYFLLQWSDVIKMFLICKINCTSNFWFKQL